MHQACFPCRRWAGCEKPVSLLEAALDLSRVRLRLHYRPLAMPDRVLTATRHSGKQAVSTLCCAATPVGERLWHGRGSSSGELAEHFPIASSCRSLSLRGGRAPAAGHYMAKHSRVDMEALLGRVESCAGYTWGIATAFRHVFTLLT